MLKTGQTGNVREIGYKRPFNLKSDKDQRYIEMAWKRVHLHIFKEVCTVYYVYCLFYFTFFTVNLSQPIGCPAYSHIKACLLPQKETE